LRQGGFAISGGACIDKGTGPNKSTFARSGTERDVTDSSFDLPPSPNPAESPSGVLARLSPLIRRLIAANPSALTFTGTCTYVVGEGEVAVIDPGPAEDAHVAALLATLAGERIGRIVVTHSHRDHVGAAPMLKAKTGAPIVGPPPSLQGSHDPSYAPDFALADGERIEGPGYTLEAVATPGHATNHVCYALLQENALFSGDHVMAWSTSVIAPPDGSMGDYLASLEKLRLRGETIYWPGHGGPVREPQRHLRALIHHRRQREAAILARLDAGEATIAEIVAKVYPGLGPALARPASLSTLAHLEDLMARGLVASDGVHAFMARYRRVA
jgi:glyoxylase-like metal-dependent hydrolase (beta-lactamase superfamily II)